MAIARALAIFLPLALFAGCDAHAHSGALDGNGCHYEKDTGAYHCHQEVPPNPNVDAPVKKSRNNICHDETSPNYRTIRYFIAFPTIEACLTSGGRRIGT